MSPPLKDGDVFTIPLGDGRCGFGQVVGTYQKGVHYFAVFELLVDESSAEGAVDDALASRLVFLAQSLDARLHHGMWRVVANREVDPAMPFPAYKVDIGYPPVTHVVDHTGGRTRPATEDEAELLPYRTTVAPIALEKALQAKAGLAPWMERFNDLAPDERATSARLLR